VTVTANIHFGLTAWASGTFALGQRCSSGGNAYQCLVAGSSTSAPTGTGAQPVNNGGVAWFIWLSAIDYTTVQAWWNALPSTLTQNVIGQVWNNGTVTTTTTVAFLNTSLSVKTVGSFTSTLTAAPGESICDTLAGQVTPLAFNAAAGASFTAPTGSALAMNWFNITVANFTLSRLQVKDANTADTSSLFFSSAAGTILDKCIFDGFSQTNPHNMVYPSGATSIIRNCLLVDRANGGFNTVQFDTSTGKIVNCAILSVAGTGNCCVSAPSGASGSILLENTSLVGSTTFPIFSGTGGILANNNAFSAASLPTYATGTNNKFSQTAAATYVGTTTDFRLLSTAPSVNAGLVDTTNIPTSDDIGGFPRGTVNWDMGPLEYQPAVPNSSQLGLPPAIKIWDH
jgi:hypothetical protein